jgi:hypothetical protein
MVLDVLVAHLNTTISIILVLIHPELAFNVHVVNKAMNIQFMALYILYQNCRLPAV